MSRGISQDKELVWICEAGHATMRCLQFALLLHMMAAVRCHINHHVGRKEVVLEVDGDIRLGALFPIHKQVPGGSRNGGKPCGEIRKEDGIQPLEALLFALDEINSDPDLLPGVKLGLRAIDSCDDPYYAADRSFELIKGFVSRHTNLSCLVHYRSGPLSREWPCGDNLVGLIGPQTTSVSVEVASLGRLFHVPQVSYLATSVTLCSREKFPYFFRTVPSDKHQAKAIVELLDSFNWTYASIVHSDSDYGITGYEALRRHVSKNRRLCLADPITIYNNHFGDEDYVAAVRKLSENRLSRVVIVFADRVPAGRLLEAAKAEGMRDQFTWVGSDAWASREEVVKDREAIVEGAIAVQPLRRKLPHFDEYFTSLMRKTNPRNPWFEEYLKHFYNCSSYPNSSDPCDEVKDKNAYTMTQYSQQLYIHFVRDAVYAFAHALDRLHRDSCGLDIRRKLCPEFKVRVFEDLKDYLQRVKFPDVDGQMFEFFGHDKHDGPPRYSIINFQRKRNGSGQAHLADEVVDPGEFDWRNVATFHYDAFSKWDDDFRRKLHADSSISRCLRQPCGPSEVKVQDTEDACCWHCRPCSDVEFKVSEYECRKCPLGTRSIGGNSTGCVEFPLTHLDYTNPWAIASITFALAGIALTFLIMVVVWRF